MPIDVSILRQQAPMQMPSLMESRARANQLMASDAQLAANALQIQKLQREEQQAQDINKLYSLPGAVGASGELDYGVIGQAAPGMGLARLLPELNKQRLAEMKARGEAGEATYKQAKARDEAINARLGTYREKYRFVTTPEAALAMHDQVHADPILQPFFNAMGVDAAQGRARIQEAIANGTFPQFLQEQSSALDQVRDQRYVQALNRDVDEAVKPPTTRSEVGEREGVRTSDVQAPRVNVLGGPDGQIIRIQLMADQAQREGRLDIAQKLLAQAKSMQDTLLAGQPEDYRLFKLEQMDKEFKARRTELAKLRQQSVSVSLPPSQKAEQTKRGEFLVDEYKEIASRASGAARSVSRIDAAQRTLDKGFSTGWGTETIAAAAGVLSALGVEKARDYATSAQTFLAQGREKLLEKQLEQKGVQTEGDYKRMDETFVRLGNTTDANRFLLAAAKADAQRDAEKKRFWDKWYRDHNDTYDGASEAWDAGPGNKSIFDYPSMKPWTERPKQPAAPAAPAGGRGAPAEKPPLGSIFK